MEPRHGGAAMGARTATPDGPRTDLTRAWRTKGTVGGLHVLESKIKATPYPYGFEPTLHRYRLNQPERKKEGRTVFVCAAWRTCSGRWCRRNGSGTFWTPARGRRSTDTCF